MPFPQFDRSRLKLLPLAQRVHDLNLSVMLCPEASGDFSHPTIDLLARRIRAAREKGAPVLMTMGAHVIRAGAAPLLIRLMEQGFITHFALNGAGGIHDFEFALIGATTESVAKYISEGQFGLWEEDALYNEAVRLGVTQGLGFGEALGKYIWEECFPHRDISLLAAGYRLQVPVTVHVGIGCDIVHEQPNADGAVTGEATYRDFLIYAHTVEKLEDGVFLNFGSAVIGPEVYLKALSMARNVAKQRGERIGRFTTAVFDLLPLEGQDVHETPPKADPRYYFRPWKTIMARTVADDGESYYVQGQHRDTVAALAHLLLTEG
ncbi:MAG: hypothetical protein LBU67_00840 [Oscillospiraceae bacterium]|nr:hypothetical protein [Oscillospiraceae bacterium]